MNTETYSIKDLQNYAWNYFCVHATHRMNAFNFCIIISGLLFTSLATSLVKGYILLTSIISIVLIITQYAFWKLDQRIRFLAKNAESTLKEIESIIKDIPQLENIKSLAIFRNEEKSTNNKRKSRFNIFKLHLTYPYCFGVIYISFVILGVIGFIMSILIKVKVFNV